MFGKRTLPQVISVRALQMWPSYSNKQMTRMTRLVMRISCSSARDLPKCLVRRDFMGRKAGTAEVDHARCRAQFVPNTQELGCEKIGTLPANRTYSPPVFASDRPIKGQVAAARVRHVVPPRFCLQAVALMRAALPAMKDGQHGTGLHGRGGSRYWRNRAPSARER
jgi:hypothetical protein